MVNLNKEVVNILKTLYDKNQIYHNNAPLDGEYPLIVYNRITNVPAKRADNKTYGSRLVYRITVIDKFETDEADIREAFENAGWLWEGTNITQDKNVNEIDEIYTSVDVSILKQESEEQNYV